MKTLRKILFYIFLAVYLVLCPLIILYAFGYIFTPKVEEGFAKTGLIHVETLPANATVSIANRRYVGRTPATVRNLLPGSYDVKISLGGYRPWVRKVNVEPGKAANFEKVLLIPQKLSVQAVENGPFDDLWPVRGTRYFLLKGSSRAGDLKVFDWKNVTLRPVFPGGSAVQGAELIRVFKVRESSFVLLELKNGERTEFWGCQLDQDKPAPEDLTRLFQKESPDEVLWEGNHPDFLFVLYGSDLARLDLEKDTVLPGFLEKIRGFGLYKNKIYALRGSSVIRLSLNSKKGEETVVEQGVFLDNLFRSGGRYMIDFIANNAVCFRGDQGELFSNVLPYRFVREGMRGYQTGNGGRKIVLWQAKRVGVLDFEKPEHKRELFERGPEIDWVFEGGTDIRQAFFVYDGAYVLFRDGAEVSLVRVGESESHVEKLLKVREGSPIFYSEKAGRLYFLGPIKSELMSAEILPEGVSFAGVMNELEKETQGVVK